MLGFMAIKGHVVTNKRWRYSRRIKQSHQVLCGEMPRLEVRAINRINDEAIVPQEAMHALIGEQADVCSVMEKAIVLPEAACTRAIEIGCA